MRNPQDYLDVDIRRDHSGIWILQGHDSFEYSDGRSSERYLRSILENACDLTDGSEELETAIRDWPSEYHLSSARSRLLAGFNFDPSARILEIGCGCGGITRYLGENFQSVMAIEGSPARARLAQLRTRDLNGVSVICAPFQALRFKVKFDLIVCIGVFEYAGLFVEGADSHDAVLRFFAECLAPGGAVLIAIENQFGLKYFNGHSEDHLGQPFEGIEGYHSRPRYVRTFGRIELRDRLKKHFNKIDFYYPFPDYKLPSCVIDDDFISTIDAGELVSQFSSRSYARIESGLWDEGLVAMELAKNHQLPFFSNSFLVIAYKDYRAWCNFPQNAIIFTSDRLRVMRSVTRIFNDSNGRRKVEKTLASGFGSASNANLRLVCTQSDWQDGVSLQTDLFIRCRNAELKLEEIFQPCTEWLQCLRNSGIERSGEVWLAGRYVDGIWSNFYYAAGRRVFTDLEWELDRDLPLNTILIRAIYVFLSRLHGRRCLNHALGVRSGKILITRIAAGLGVKLTSNEFARFVKLQTEFSTRSKGTHPARTMLIIYWFLLDRPTLYTLMSIWEFFKRLMRSWSTWLYSIRD